MYEPDLLSCKTLRVDGVADLAGSALKCDFGPASRPTGDRLAFRSVEAFDHEVQFVRRGPYPVSCCGKLAKDTVGLGGLRGDQGRFGWNGLWYWQSLGALISCKPSSLPRGRPAVQYDSHCQEEGDEDEHGPIGYGLD